MFLLLIFRYFLKRNVHLWFKINFSVRDSEVRDGLIGPYQSVPINRSLSTGPYQQVPINRPLSTVPYQRSLSIGPYQPVLINRSLSITNIERLTNSTQHSPSWEDNRSSASQEIPRILCNPKVHYRFHKCLPPLHVLSQINPVHVPHPASWRSILISSSHLHLVRPSGLVPSGYPTKSLCALQTRGCDI